MMFDNGEKTEEGKHLPIEKPAVAQVTPDDLVITINSVEVRDGYLGKLALYKMVSTNNETGKSYTLMKRYSHFADLDSKLQDKYRRTHMFEKHYPKIKDYAPKFNRLFTNHFTKSFLAERRSALTDYINTLSEFPGMSQDPVFRRFLGVPEIKF